MKLIFLVAVLLGHTASALAGGSDGNGGQSVVCSETDGPEELLGEAYDLYEGHELFGYKYGYGNSFGGSPLTVALAYAASLDRTSGTGTDLQDRVRRVAAMIDEAPDAGDLDLTTDIHPFFLPQNCALVQTLVFRPEVRIDVNHQAWDRLDSRSRTALYLHEALYWRLRDVASETNSRRTRRIVSYLLGGNDPAAAPEALTSFDGTPTYCAPAGGPQRVTSPRIFLFLDPSGQAGALFPDGSGYSRSLLSGRIDGARLVDGSLFSPAADSSLAGREAGRPFRLDLRAGERSATFVSRSGGGTPVRLNCHPYEEIIP